MNRSLRLGTRGSPLALWQADRVQNDLRKIYPDHSVEVVILKTTGDKNQTSPLAEIGTSALFTAEIDRALLSGEVDFGVHSLKDCESVLESGIYLAAVLERGSPFDSFVPAEGVESVGFSSLLEGSSIATGSLRRRAQILAARPDLVVEELRGNIDTRLEQRNRPGLAGVLMAEAALLRLGRHVKREVLPAEIMLPAVCQGIVGITTREGDEEIATFVRAINCEETMSRALAERAMLRVLEGGCRVPAGAFAVRNGDTIHLRALIAAVDGSRVVTREGSADVYQGESLGRRLGEEILAAGGAEILNDIRFEDLP